MIKSIKKLKELNKLKKDKKQMESKGFDEETLKHAIETQKNQLEYELNGFGWFLVFLIIIPLALIQLGLSAEIAIFGSYVGGGVIVFLLNKITNRNY